MKALITRTGSRSYSYVIHHNSTEQSLSRATFATDIECLEKVIQLKRQLQEFGYIVRTKGFGRLPS